MIEAATAFWLGILTSISPCPLASNIAALSFCLRGGPTSRKAALFGTAYSIGRAAAYTGLAMLIAAAGLSTPTLSDFLQRYMNKALGPILVLTGTVLLDLLPIGFWSWRPSEAWTSRLVSGGALGSAGMGFLLALAFCPVSAALFFGALIPLAVKSRSFALLPFVYGFATGLPVLLFAAAISGGTATLAKSYATTAVLERWMRIVTGAVLVLLGAYFTFRHIFHIL
ncbi:MAG: aromatic aminobenezylarsenical efflux permease ArsG family transporter [Elusimicrobia bacterium]|nr:aromatic aminobenezylarsenical efflux permease ArsG family transporter [Elusimicrobiota bacterium]